MKIFDEVTVPHSVFQEVTVAGKPGEAEIKALANLKVVELSEANLKAVARLKGKLNKWRLDSAALDALYLARKVSEMLLTDDLDAREAAQSLGMEVHGSVGIIIRAFKLKALARKDAVLGLTGLYEKSRLFVSRAIIEDAIRETRKVRR